MFIQIVIYLEFAFQFQMASLYFLLDRENVLTKSVTNILRKFMSRDIALRFTAVKQSLGKLILKDTYFAECLKGKKSFTILLHEKV